MEIAIGTYCKSKDQDVGMIWSHSVESFEPKKWGLRGCGIKELISESPGVVILVSRPNWHKTFGRSQQK